MRHVRFVRLYRGVALLWTGRMFTPLLRLRVAAAITFRLTGLTVVAGARGAVAAVQSVRTFVRQTVVGRVRTFVCVLGVGRADVSPVVPAGRVSTLGCLCPNTRRSWVPVTQEFCSCLPVISNSVVCGSSILTLPSNTLPLTRSLRRRSGSAVTSAPVSVNGQSVARSLPALSVLTQPTRSVLARSILAQPVLAQPVLVGSVLVGPVLGGRQAQRHVHSPSHLSSLIPADSCGRRSGGSTMTAATVVAAPTACRCQGGGF